MWRVSVAVAGLLLACGASYLQAARPPRANTVAGTPAAVARRQPSPPPSTPATAPRALLDTYCVTCHNQRLKTAGLTLDQMDLEHVGAAPDVWEKVVRKLRSGTMPPDRMPRPDATATHGLVSWLEAALDQASAAAPDPGRPLIHRLNRTEYINAVRDLLGIELDGKALLAGDDSSYGFDNIADVLTVSPGLLERYLLAAKKVSRLAIGDPNMPAGTETYNNPYLTLVQQDRMSEDLPFGSRGGMAVRHYFPLDAEYVIKIGLERTSLNGNESLRGLADPNLIEVRIDGVLAKRFAIGGKPSGGGPPGPDRNRIHDDAEARLEVRLSVKAGMRAIGVTFQGRDWYVEGVAPSRLPVASEAYSTQRDYTPQSGKVETGIANVQISGPFNGTVPEDTPTRRRIFVCRPTARNADACARTILVSLARRAYRRPVTADEVGTLLAFYKTGASGGTFDAGIQAALTRILTDPNFLFRIERDPDGAAPGTIYRISDIELASRLSFFLWSSIPDDGLLDLASRGMLKDPVVLEREVRRMLRDPRSNALVTNFFGQWLYVRGVRTHKPDQIGYFEFDENLRNAFIRETELFLDSQIREDRSVLDLLTANYTFLNERLARHYGIPNVYGSHFRRVTFSDDRRAGILGQGSILTITSYNNRTSPVVRGKWLLENILGTPPPPPPPNVPLLKEDQGDHPTSMRARMEQHRRNPVCANCHAKLDPLGFALENFDAVGRWRTVDGDATVDPSGSLPDGTPFAGPAEFRQALLKHREEFVTTLTQKLMTYGLGRGIDSPDMRAVRAVVRETAAHDYKWLDLVLNVVKSMPFQMRRAEQ